MSSKNPCIEDEAICKGEASCHESEVESEFWDFINDESDSPRKALLYHLIPPWEEDESVEVMDFVPEGKLWWSKGGGGGGGGGRWSPNGSRGRRALLRWRFHNLLELIKASAVKKC